MADARKIAIMSGKGGTGKTFFLTSLGAILSSEFGKRVLLVEGNLTSPCIGVFLNVVRPQSTVQDVLDGTIPAEKAVFRHDNGLDILPGALSIGKVSKATPFKEKILDPLSDRYDFILVDCSGTIAEDDLIIAEACGEAIIVTLPELPSVTGSMKLVGTLNSQGIRALGIVKNRVFRGSRKNELTSQEIAGSTGQKIIGALPEDGAVFQSTYSRTPLSLFAPFSDTVVEVRGIAEDLLGMQRTEKPSFFKKIFSGKAQNSQPKRSQGILPQEHLEGIRNSVVRAAQLTPEKKETIAPIRQAPKPSDEKPPEPAPIPPRALPQETAKFDRQKAKDEYMRQWMEGKITLDQMMAKIKELEKSAQ